MLAESEAEAGIGFPGHDDAFVVPLNVDVAIPRPFVRPIQI